MGTFAGATNNWLNNTPQGIQYQIDNRLYVTDGLLLDLDAANPLSYPGTGTTWTDLSGNNNNVTLFGPSYTTDNQGALVFDGVNDYVTTPIFNSYTVSSTTQLSINLWFYLNETGTRMMLSTGHTFPNNNRLYVWSLDSKLTWNIGNSTYDTNLRPNISTNRWYNTTLVLNNSTAKIYLDGLFSYEYSFVTPFTTQSSLSIGRDGNDNEFYHKGNISQVQIYNRALSQAEVQINFNIFKGRYGL